MFRLDSAEERNAENGDRFWIPSIEDRATLQPGDFAKLVFLPEDGDGGERMWVEVSAVSSNGEDTAAYVGTLANNPIFLELEHGDTIVFTSQHIIDINRR